MDESAQHILSHQLELSRFLLRPKPLGTDDDVRRESAASWIFRLALENGFTASAGLFKSLRRCGGDMSRVDAGESGHQLLCRLQESTGIKHDEIRSLHQCRHLNVMGVDNHETGYPWLLRGLPGQRDQVGARHVICPSCVGADDTPYWRQIWRLSTLTRCPVHQCRLIDRCAECQHPCVLTSARQQPLDRCERCGQRYACFKGRRYKLDAAMWLQSTPLTLDLSDLAHSLKLSSCQAWWAGVRVLISLICRARIAKRVLASGEVPSTYLPVLRGSIGAAAARFNACAIEYRHDVMRFITWLIHDWPNRFIAVMKSSGVVAADFSTLECSVPFWIADVVASQLASPRYSVSDQEVRSAAAVRAKQGAVSKISVKRLLGVTEGIALDMLIPPKARELSDVQVTRVVQALDQEISRAPAARDEKAALLRDACCIAMAIHLQVSFTRVCQMSVEDGERVRAAWRESLARSRDPLCDDVPLIAAFARWVDRYMEAVWPRFCRYGERPDRLFLSRYGQPYGGFALGSRFAELLRRAEVKDWQLGTRLLLSTQKGAVITASTGRG